MRSTPYSPAAKAATEAAAAADSWKDRPVTLTLSHEKMSELREMAADIPYLLGHAANIFSFLHAAIMNGAASDQGVISILEMSERAFRDAETKEGNAIFHLGMEIGAAIRDHVGRAAQ